MIADRRFLASEFKKLRAELNELSDWEDNPAKPFPADSDALAYRLQWIALLLVADYDTPEERRHVGD